jgi:hypothetical protein
MITKEFCNLPEAIVDKAVFRKVPEAVEDKRRSLWGEEGKAVIRKWLN